MGGLGYFRKYLRVEAVAEMLFKNATADGGGVGRAIDYVLGSAAAALSQPVPG
jgi:hypothetical protein